MGKTFDGLKSKLDPSEDARKIKQLHRKNLKHLVEKKRRERINRSLNELKKLVFADNPEGLQSSKIEKAHILEMTVKHINSLQKSNGQIAVKHDTDDEYRYGYLTCLSRVLAFISSLDHVTTDFKSRLIENIASKLPVNDNSRQNETNKLEKITSVNESFKRNDDVIVHDNDNGDNLKCKTDNDWSTDTFQTIITKSLNTKSKNCNGTDHNDLIQETPSFSENQYNTNKSYTQNYQPSQSKTEGNHVIVYLIPKTLNNEQMLYIHNTQISDNVNATNKTEETVCNRQSPIGQLTQNEANVDDLNGKKVVNFTMNPCMMDKTTIKYNTDCDYNSQIWRPW